MNLYLLAYDQIRLVVIVNADYHKCPSSIAVTVYDNEQVPRLSMHNCITVLNNI